MRLVLLGLLPGLALMTTVSAAKPSLPRGDVSHTLHVGRASIVESKSPKREFSVLFEDDGTVAYFYGLSTRPGNNPILDTLHIYDVPNVRDENKVSKLEIRWSDDGWKAMLLLNGVAHGVFDFKARRAWNRSGFPPPNRQWTQYGHDWDENVTRLFR